MTLYWDIFRDYIINGTTPNITLDYIPQYTFSSVCRVIMVLLENNNHLQDKELSTRVGMTCTTIDNMMIDLVMFGLAKRERGVVFLTVNSLQESIEILCNFFKRHILYILMKKELKLDFDYNDFKRIFDKIYSEKLLNDKTRNVYSGKIFNWLLRLAFIEEKEGAYYISVPEFDKMRFDSQRRRSRSKFGTNSTGLFWGQSSPDKVIEVWTMINDGEDGYTILKDKGYRNAIEILTTTVSIQRKEDKLIILKSLDEVLETINESDTVCYVKELILNDANIKSLEIGEKLNEKFHRKWQRSSKLRYGNALLIWSKFLSKRYD